VSVSVHDLTRELLGGFFEIWSGLYANGDYTEVLIHYFLHPVLTSMAEQQSREVESRSAQHAAGSHNDSGERSLESTELWDSNSS
jgi:hypothetical protein